MSDWLNKILIKAKETFNLGDKDVKQIEEQIGNVDMTGVKNTADAKVLNKNNGNVPMTGAWGSPPPEGEIEGFTLFKTDTQKQQQQPTNFVELPNQQQQVEARVNNMAHQIQQQNQIKQQQQNTQSAQTQQQQKLPPQVESIVYEDGKAFVKLKNGKSFSRDAMNGEPGFVKTGENVDERLSRYYDCDFSKLTDKQKTEKMKTYMEGHFKIDPKLSKEKQDEVKKNQLKDFMTLMKNTGMKSENGKLMGSIIHSLHKDNKVKAYLDGVNFASCLEDTINYTKGMVSSIGFSGDEPEVQKQLLQTAGNTSTQWGFQTSYVQSLTQNFGAVNKKNTDFAANQAFSLDFHAATVGFTNELKASQSTEAVTQKNPQINQAVKQQLGDEFEVVSVSDEQINACSKTVCHMIETGDIAGASALFNKNIKYLGDTHKKSIAQAATNFAVNGNGGISDTHSQSIAQAASNHAANGKGEMADRKAAAELTVLATVKIHDVDTQLEVATNNAAQMANAPKEVKESYLTSNAQSLPEYHAKNQLKVDEQSREIDTEEQIYNVTASQYGQLLAVENQQEFVKRTTASGNEEAINNVANNAYEYDLSNREDILKMLKETGYESTMKTLEEARQKYEAETVKKTEKKPEETKPEVAESKSQETPTTQTTSRSSSSTEVVTSSKKIESIVSNVSTNTTQKAKQIKELNAKEQKQAIEKLMENASIPEIKGYILSGLKSEVVGYLLTNFSVDNKVKLDSIKYLMTQKELARYEELIQQTKDNKLNFFMS